MIALVRKWTWLALAIVVTFVGATFVDDCALADGESCPPACHFACIDGCAVAPMASALLVPGATEATQEPPAEATSRPLELDFPPHLIPPRA
jgi:hypothetical protein